jgi:lantibiotic modifying enzyme
VLACLSRLYGDRGLLEGAGGALRGFSRLWSGDVLNDVVSGSAGTILALLALHEVGRLPDALDVAVQGALALCDRAGGDVASLWPGAETPMLGFSHGVAGVTCALLTLLGALRAHGHDAPVQRIRALADHALAYERERFDPVLRNWPILRLPEPGVSPDRITWCHGAPGVALGRTLALPLLDDAEVRREIEVALDTMLSRGLGDEPLLCHGDLGNLMVLTHVAASLGRPSLRDLALRHASRVMADLQRERTAPDAPLREAVPNLLTGLAGVGYGLLYQAYPDVVPLVLGLRPPPLGPLGGERSPP